MCQDGNSRAIILDHRSIADFIGRRSKDQNLIDTVIAKYDGHAGHDRQTSADVRQRAQTLSDILSSSNQYT